MTLADVLLSVLREHRANDLFCGQCDCGFSFDGDDGDHAEHLASVLADAIGAERVASADDLSNSAAPVYFLHGLKSGEGVTP